MDFKVGDNVRIRSGSDALPKLHGACGTVETVERDSYGAVYTVRLDTQIAGLTVATALRKEWLELC